MPVCITGMHRSGTSLVTNFLRLCGLYLGEKEDLLPATSDNETGYWENHKFLSLNDRILRYFGGTWDSPPEFPSDWAEEAGLNSLRVEAEILLKEFIPHEPWGWKDPRNSLTLPFWMSLNGLRLPFFLEAAPKLKVVICIRNPLEVFESLRDRRHTPNSEGLSLWSVYYKRVLGSVIPQDRIITHYDSYFHDARAELRRIIDFLEIRASEQRLNALKTSEIVRHKHVHPHHSRARIVDTDVLELYREMCREANYSEGASATP